MSVASQWSLPECAISATKYGALAAPISQRILGIDPGLRLTGFGLIDCQGAQRRYVASGVIKVPVGELPMRLATIFESLQKVIAAHKPTACAIEKVFVNVNPASTLLLGHARGAAMTALAVNQLSVAEYTALQVKQAVVGYGKANKEQVQMMVTKLLGLSAAPSADAADALACALCHANASQQATIFASALPPSLKGLRIKRGRLVP